MTLTWHNETRKLSELKPYEHNPRTMTVATAKRLEKSLKDTGYAEVIAIDADNTIVAGHQRYHTLIKLYGFDYEVDVRVPCRKLTDKEFKDYLVASNKDVGDWDYDVLAALFDVDELLEKGFTMPDLGIDDVDEIEQEEDEVPEEPSEQKTVLGDLYELGDHRLLCGSSTLITDITTLLEDNTIDCVVTDPPYGVDYSSKNEMLNKFNKGNKCQREIKNDAIKDYRSFFSEFMSIIPLSEYNTFYIFMSGQELHNLRLALDDCGIKLGDYLIWAKNNHVLARKDYNAKHEFCVYGWKGKHKFHAKDHRTTILAYDKPTKNDLHPTMKPIPLLCQVIQDGSAKGMNVYDAFCGSGSTLIACQQTGRRCFMMELEPIYCDVIVQRYINYMKKNDKPYTIKRNGKEIEWE